MNGPVGRSLRGIATTALSLVIMAFSATAALADGPDLPPSKVHQISTMLGHHIQKAPAGSSGGGKLVLVIALVAGLTVVAAALAWAGTIRHKRLRVASSS